MSDRKTTPLTPKAQHPERTQQFVSVVAESLESFEDSIGSLDENIKSSAYETFITSYKDALSRIWRPAAAADTKLILKTITDKQLVSLTEMAKRLEPQPSTAKVSVEKAKDSRFGNFDINAERSMPQATSSKFEHLQTNFRSIFQTGRSS